MDDHEVERSNESSSLLFLALQTANKYTDLVNKFQEHCERTRPDKNPDIWMVEHMTFMLKVVDDVSVS
jgi:hypothetical protein